MIGQSTASPARDPIVPGRPTICMEMLMFAVASKPASRSDAHRRSLAKAVSWRVTGSIDTFILSWLITGNVKIAGSISLVEIVTKILLFYFHERIWAWIPWERR
jgi:uncharacterized membrane protein